MSKCVMMALGLLVVPVAAGDQGDYRAGADFARQVQGKGVEALKNAQPEQMIPNYSNSPKEKKYYGGVTAESDGELKNDGATAWSVSETGQAVNESVVNNPKEKLSPDAPFIQAGREIESKAELVVGKTGPDCKAEQVTHSTFTRHVCERDTAVFRTCDRVVEIGGKETTPREERRARIEPTALHWWIEGRQIRGRFTAPFSGKVNDATVKVNRWPFSYPISLSVLGMVFDIPAYDQELRVAAASNVPMTAGEKVDVVLIIRPDINFEHSLKLVLWGLNTPASDRSATFTLELSGYTGGDWVPTTLVPPACALEKEAGAVKVNTECSEVGGERTVELNGQRYTVSASCWRFTDTYRLQAASQGNCEVYANNPACTVAMHGCAFSDEQGACLRENVTYSCEHRTIGTVMLCGGEPFCLDGDCENTQKGKNNDFKQAVSELAAVAAAGKAIAGINSVDIKAFTGQVNNPEFIRE